MSRQHAIAIWNAAVAAVQPSRCVPEAVRRLELSGFDQIRVVGGGKAGAAMAVALEEAVVARGIDLGRVVGLVNVPTESVVPTQAVRLNPARPMGINYPTAEAQAGTEAMLAMAGEAGPQDLFLCLISGGGSALLPAPVPGISLADKQRLTQLLHRSGATIQEMNAVRKHLSRIKGGGLVRRFTGKKMISLILSDVIGDPLDVIASGPTAADPTTFADAVDVLRRYDAWEQTPASIRVYLDRGQAGEESETLKHLPAGRVENHVIANNAVALEAATAEAERRGFRVLSLGSQLQGESRHVAALVADMARRQPPGTCILGGGETTVTLPSAHGLGGRNQEFVLACLQHLGESGMVGLTIVSGGTDGEDGPTEAAGAVADLELLRESRQRALDPQTYLERHDAYHFFEPLGGLLKSGLTQTNVMDVHVLLVNPPN